MIAIVITAALCFASGFAAGAVYMWLRQIRRLETIAAQRDRHAAALHELYAQAAAARQEADHWRGVAREQAGYIRQSLPAMLARPGYQIGPIGIN